MKAVCSVNSNKRITPTKAYSTKILNYFKLTEAIAPFPFFFFNMRLSFLPLLHYTYIYLTLLFMWFLLFLILFRLENGTHGGLLFDNHLPRSFLTQCCQKMLNTTFVFWSILLFLQTFCSVSWRLNIFSFTFVIACMGLLFTISLTVE